MDNKEHGRVTPDRRTKLEEQKRLSNAAASAITRCPKKTMPPLRTDPAQARGHGLRSKRSRVGGHRNKGRLYFLAVE